MDDGDRGICRRIRIRRRRVRRLERREHPRVWDERKLLEPDFPCPSSIRGPDGIRESELVPRYDSTARKREAVLEMGVLLDEEDAVRDVSVGVCTFVRLEALGDEFCGFAA